ncbi:MAG TPA: hypothetical protein VF598_10120 [Hymenobacter sp.]
MKRRIVGINQRGDMNVLAVPLILAVLLLVGSIVFGAWAFTSREDYRVNVEEKIAIAVKVAKQEEGIAKDKEHAEAEKQPLKSYNGPEAFGSVGVQFPKTWSGYVQDEGGSAPLDTYFHPGVVPSLSAKGKAYALRVQVVEQAYSKVVSDMNKDVAAKKVTAAAYALPKQPKVVGVRFDGAIGGSGKDVITGAMVVMPVRDKTLKIWTESPLFVADFNGFILPNVTFIP